MSLLIKAQILDMGSIAQNIYKMTLDSYYIAQNAIPGQFINIRCCEGIDALLRRPVSICNVDRGNNSFDIAFMLKGKGTKILSGKQAGSHIDIVGPLGKPFYVDSGFKRIAVVGGGIGIFPLFFLLNEKPEAEIVDAYLGFKNRESVVLLDNFRHLTDNLFISTDDGSEGWKGLITDLFEHALKDKKYDIIYACGPFAMLRKVAGIAEANEIKCQVSLEQRMGCGIGACLVCSVKTKHGDDWQYSRVCKDGPVFWSNEVIWE